VKLLLPKSSLLQQSGIPSALLSSSIEALRRVLLPLGAGGSPGPATAGWVAPPTTCCMVRTTTPLPD